VQGLRSDRGSRTRTPAPLAPSRCRTAKATRTRSQSTLARWTTSGRLRRSSADARLGRDRASPPASRSPSLRAVEQASSSTRPAATVLLHSAERGAMSLLHATRRRSGTVGTRQSFLARPARGQGSYPDHIRSSSEAAVDVAEPAASMEEQRSRPARLLVVRSERVECDRGRARMRTKAVPQNGCA
jgi:hypothetical protein